MSANQLVKDLIKKYSKDPPKTGGNQLVKDLIKKYSKAPPKTGAAKNKKIVPLFSKDRKGEQTK